MYTSTSPYAGIVGLVMSAECPVCEHKLPFEADCQWCALKEECESWQEAHDAMCALNARTTEERDRYRGLLNFTDDVLEVIRNTPDYAYICWNAASQHTLNTMCQAHAAAKMEARNARNERDRLAAQVAVMRPLIKCLASYPCPSALKDFRGSWCKNCHILSDLGPEADALLAKAIGMSLVFKCDGCGNQYMSDTLPTTWFMLQAGEDMLSLHFCSPACIKLWTEEEREP